jgi:PTS system fructose-specific IIC component
MTTRPKFTKQTVLPAIEATTIEAALDELLGVCAEAYGFGDDVRKLVRNTLKRKAEQGATGAIGHGVAVPHVKVAGVEQTSVVFARSEVGIDFGAPDGAPVNLVFFVVGPEEAPEAHLDFMRWVATISRSADFRRFAAACKGEKELRELLEEMGDSA